MYHALCNLKQARVERMDIAYKVFVAKSEGSRTLDRPGC
jgi:hypothetical protein